MAYASFSPDGVDSVDLKNVLADIQTDRGLHSDGSPHVIRLRRTKSIWRAVYKQQTNHTRLVACSLQPASKTMRITMHSNASRSSAE